MLRRSFLAGALTLALCPWPARAETPIERAAREAVGNAATAADKVRSVISWTHRNLEWTSTDYQERTPEQILARGGGNCYEQAKLVRALLDPAGVRTRLTREINVQPASAQRQRDAEAQVAQVGPRGSVFGERHNDHVWTEYHDSESGEWLPADPTLDIIGVAGWVGARLGFGARPVHDVIPFADMLFPMAVVVPLGEGRYERRTDRLLVRGFADHVDGVAQAPEWPRWARLVRTAEDHLIGALRNEYSLHRDGPLIAELSGVYEALREGSRSRRA